MSGGATEKRVIQRTITAVFSLAIMACSESPLPPEQRLEHYLKSHAGLQENGWHFYAVEQRGSELRAYVSFPPSARIAPHEHELQRLCPDSSLHDFWEANPKEHFDLLLIGKVRATEGKAKRLAQVTCERDFDLVEFEASTLAEPEPEAPAAPKKDQPEAVIPAYAIAARVVEAPQLAQTFYHYPAAELKKAKRILDRFHDKDIDLSGMQVYYPDFPKSIAGVPFFEKGFSQKPDKPRYAKYVYEHGYVRAELAIQPDTQWMKRKVFYNDLAAPVLVVESGSERGSSYAYVLEYDERGFLHRVSQFSTVWDKLVRVMVYQVGDSYDDAVVHAFSPDGEDWLLESRFRHTGEGSFVWTRSRGSERKYTSTPLSSFLDYRGRYPALKPVLPMPRE